MHLGRDLPEKSFVVLEARADVGGTWDLFRYPGIRSDSDLHTFGYAFKPWRHEEAIADAPLIQGYLHETVEEFDLTDHVRLQHRVVRAQWSTDESIWTLTVEAVDPRTGETSTSSIRAGWVFAATGYYRYDQGFAPEFAGREDFAGAVVHPQHWPADLDYRDKKVVIIGSGATAITMVPAMATGDGAAAHITMLQRTPSYILAAPRVDVVAKALTAVLGVERGYAATRVKNIWMDRAIVKGLRTFPRAGRRAIRWATTRSLPDGFDVDRHFNPPYNPWDQRLCLAPDGDFFDAISSGAASVVTDRIERFSPHGIVLESGQEVEADIIVTATGLNLRLFDGMPIEVDGNAVDVAESVCYRGVLLSGIPNWAMAIGYTTSSWTLKVGLMCRYFVDLLRHMDHHGYVSAMPVAPAGMDCRPVMDLQAGYAKRGESVLPKQGVDGPWRMAMSYPEDAKALRGHVADDSLHFRAGAGATSSRSARRRAHV
ncbi:flavin-containing monooxygenase [Dermacoccaceae bacterium W4C1]